MVPVVKNALKRYVAQPVLGFVRVHQERIHAPAETFPYKGESEETDLIITPSLPVGNIRYTDMIKKNKNTNTFQFFNKSSIALPLHIHS